jgi:hypothetical protein
LNRPFRRDFVNRDSDDARDVVSRKRSSEFRIALAHFTEYLTVHSITAGVLGIRSEAHGNFPGFQVEGDFGGLLLIGFRRIQIHRCAERRMPGKWQFRLDREDADLLSFRSFSGIVTRQNESRFRKIHLPRQGLHLAVIQSSAVREDRQRITRKRRLRKYIELNELVSSVRHKKLLNVCLRTGKTNNNFLSANYSVSFAVLANLAEKQTHLRFGLC